MIGKKTAGSGSKPGNEPGTPDIEAPDVAVDSVEKTVDESATEAGNGEESEAPDIALLLEDARGRADKHWDQCLRLQAEVDNLHKRSKRDLENAHKYALDKFSVELLGIRDSLEMGLAAVDQDSVDPVKLKEGSELTLKMLVTVMEKFGIQQIDPEGGSFDPEFHQAMSIQQRGDVEPNTVITVVQKGYLLHERLLRPALVIVSKQVQEEDGTKVDEQG